MRLARLTIGGGMALVALSALAIGAMTNPSADRADAVFSLAVGLIFAAAVVVIARPGRPRVAAAGFAICSAGYCYLVGPYGNWNGRDASDHDDVDQPGARGGAALADVRSGGIRQDRPLARRDRRRRGRGRARLVPLAGAGSSRPDPSLGPPATHDPPRQPRPDPRAAGQPPVPPGVPAPVPLRRVPGRGRLLRVAGDGAARQRRPRSKTFRYVLPRPVLPGRPRRAELRGGEHHGGEGAEDL